MYTADWLTTVWHPFSMLHQFDWGHHHGSFWDLCHHLSHRSNTTLWTLQGHGAVSKLLDELWWWQTTGQASIDPRDSSQKLLHVLDSASNLGHWQDDADRTPSTFSQLQYSDEGWRWRPDHWGARNIDQIVLKGATAGNFDRCTFFLHFTIRDVQLWVHCDVSSWPWMALFETVCWSAPCMHLMRLLHIGILPLRCGGLLRSLRCCADGCWLRGELLWLLFTCSWLQTADAAAAPTEAADWTGVFFDFHPSFLTFLDACVTWNSRHTTNNYL